MVSAVSQIGWNNSASVFEEYLKEVGERLAWVAFVHDQFAGSLETPIHSTMIWCFCLRRNYDERFDDFSL